MKKVLFSLNITEDKQNTITDEQPLVSKKLENWEREELDKAINEGNELQIKASLPGWLKLIKLIAFFSTVIIFFGVISSIFKGNTFGQTYNNAPYFFYIFPFTLLIWVGLSIYGRIKSKNVVESNDLEDYEKQVDLIIQKSKDEFNVPEEALVMDILGFRYKNQDDQIKVVTSGITQYINVSMSFFIRNNKLCIANIEQIVEIDLSDLVSIERIDKKILFPQWNKEESFKKEPYKKYKIQINQYGILFVKPYYIVSFNINGQLYDLYLPVYEISNFVKLVGSDYIDEFIG